MTSSDLTKTDRRRVAQAMKDEFDDAQKTAAITHKVAREISKEASSSEFSDFNNCRL